MRTSTCPTTIPRCVPWNIFQIGGVTPDQLAYLQIPGVQEGSTIEQMLSGSISGDLGRYGIKLPTANDGLAFALGAEYRSERSELRPDAAYQTNDLFGQGAPTLDTIGGFDVFEAVRRIARADPAGPAAGAGAVGRNRLPLVRLQPRLRHRQLQARSRLGAGRQRPPARQLSACSALAERAGAVPAAARPAERHHRSVRGRSDQCDDG